MALRERLELAEALKTHSIKVRPVGQEFTLASGQKSRVYCDVKKTVMREFCHGLLRVVLREAFTSLRFESHGTRHSISIFRNVAGVVLGGCHLASIAGLDQGFNVFHVRKESKDHGTKNLVEGPSIEDQANKNVVLLEDVVTTGESSVKAMTALDRAGLCVVGVVALVDRRLVKDGLLGGVPFKAVFDIAELVDLEHA